MDRKYKEIQTSELRGLMGINGVLVIDVRPVDAFNGWRLQNEPRGGHIQGAKSLPVKWIRYLDWIEIVRHKRILPRNRIILYGYSKEETLLVAGRFERAGYRDVSLYDHFMDEWTADEALPMERLERFKHLVHPHWVSDLIAGKKPESYRGGLFMIVHAHYRNRDAYLSGHIPGAIDMDTIALESPGDWNRRNPQELKKAFEEYGITSSTTVVVYGKYMDPDNRDEFPGSAAGDIGAIRIASIMMYAGVKDVRVLNGGFQSWTDEGLEVSFADEPKKPVKDFGTVIPAHPELIIDIGEAKNLIASPDAELVCVRSWPEYIGEVSGYNYIEKKGRIPGAVFADCGSDAYHMENYRNLDHTCRDYHEISGNWMKNWIVPEKRLAFYCGTGWRGSEAWFNAWLMGWPRVAVYDGGWLEWSSDPANPIETGIPVTNLLAAENREDEIAQIFEELKREKKSIPSRFFYNEAGSLLFEKITALPEYYPTRTELSIVKTQAASILGDFDTLDIIDLGSGNELKASVLLSALPENRMQDVRYIPVDVSESALTSSAVRLKDQYPSLHIHPLLADFMKEFTHIPRNGRKLFCFFGSTIGNLDTADAHEFLRRMKNRMEPGDMFLLGLDMVKDRQTLHDAYNDSLGVTAEFNLNILNAVNAFAGTNFDTGDFEHLAVYNEACRRMEMYLEAKRDIEIRSQHFPDKISLSKGERIHTENSHKYTRADIEGYASASGLTLGNIYTDSRGWFSLLMFVYS